jgi:hypothetical protein
VVIGHDGHLACHGGVLQIAVGDGSTWVEVGHESGLHLGRKGTAPKVRVAPCVTADAAHAGLGGVSGSHEGGQFGHNLSQVGGSAAQACGQGGEGVEMPAQDCSVADSVVLGSVDFFVFRKL